MEVLIIDDEPGIRTAVAHRLSSLGYSVRTAEDGHQGLRLLFDRAPDILLLDVNLPGIDGFEILRQVRSMEPSRRIYILMLTGRAAVNEVERGLLCGADDYLTKPFDLRELTARVGAASRLQRLQQELRHANALLSRAKTDLERTLGTRDALIHKMSMELETAARLQQHLLPPARIDCGRFRLDALYRPSSRVGGDLFEVRLESSGVVRLLLADAAGHGVSAALLAAMLKMAMGEEDLASREPAPLLTALNRRFQFCGETGQFLSAFSARLDTGSGELVYSNAGMVSPLLLRGLGGSAVPLDTPGFCLGIFEEGSYQTRVSRLDPGDRLVLYTDGLSEASRNGGEDFGNRLPELLQASSGLDNQALLDFIADKLRSHLQGEEPPDDYTLLSIQCAS